MSTISSSAVEGALLVRMRRTERELREIEGEVQRWKDTLSRGTRNETSSFSTMSEAEQKVLDELPTLCSEALQSSMTLRRRAEQVRRSMTHIRNAAAEQSSARQGIVSSIPNRNNSNTNNANTNSSATTSSAVAATTSTSSPSTTTSSKSTGKNATTFHSGGGSALAYFVEDFVNSEFGMQEQAWWDVMTDIERVEALAVQLLAVPSSEQSASRVRNTGTLYQSKPADWTIENWDAAIAPSVGAPLGVTSSSSMNNFSSSHGNNRGGFSPQSLMTSSSSASRGSPLNPSSGFAGFTSTPISDLLLRRLQEQNRAKGLYAAGGGQQQYLNNTSDGDDNQSSSHIGPIFASLAANPEVISATDIDRLPKSDPLALFMSQMTHQLEEERKLQGQVQDSRFSQDSQTSPYVSRNNNISVAPTLSEMANNTTGGEPSFSVLRPGDVEKIAEESARQRERDIEEANRREAAAALAALEKQREQEAAALAEKQEQERKEQEEKDRIEEAERRRKQQLEEAAAATAEAERQLKEQAEHEAEEEAKAAEKKKQEEKEKEEQEQKAKAAAEKEEKEAAAAAAKKKKEEAEQKEGEEEEKEEEKKKTLDQQQSKLDEIENEASSTPITEKEQQEETADAATSEQEEKKEETSTEEKEEQAEENKVVEEESPKKEQETADVEQKQEETEKQSSQEEKEQQQEEEAEKSSESKVETATEEEKKEEEKPAEKQEEEEKKQEDKTPSATSTPAGGNTPRAGTSSSAAENNADNNGEEEKSEADKAVEAEISSGRWKKVKDGKGREYFYNPSTKKTAWDLAKELGFKTKKCAHKKEEK